MRWGKEIEIPIILSFTAVGCEGQWLYCKVIFILSVTEYICQINV